MTHKERFDLLVAWVETGLDWEEAEKEFVKLLGIEDESCCPILYAAFKLRKAYTKSVAARVGDTFNWLDWWWYDNKRGRGGMKAKAAAWKRRRFIRTVEDLCRLIEADCPK